MPRLVGVWWGLWRLALLFADSVLGFLLLFFRRRVILGAAAALAVVVLWSQGSTRSAIQSVLEKASHPLLQRAAFSWEEKFDGELRDWTDPSSLAPDDSGAVRVHGLALNGRTMRLRNYEMNFSARLERKSIGWVVRAANPGNYYVFKLTEQGGRTAEGRKFELVRYPVIDGRAPARSERETVHLTIRAPESGFLDISVRVTEEQIFTVVNGYGVDTWKHPQLKAGGLGFLAEKGESFSIKSLTISGNEDFLGLFIWGAEQTFRSIRKNLVSLAATRLIVSPSPQQAGPE